MIVFEENNDHITALELEDSERLQIFTVQKIAFIPTIPERTTMNGTKTREESRSRHIHLRNEYSAWGKSPYDCCFLLIMETLVLEYSFCLQFLNIFSFIYCLKIQKKVLFLATKIDFISLIHLITVY